MMIRFFFSLLSLLVSMQVLANSLPKQAAIPGGVVIVPLSADLIVKPKVTFRGKQVAVVQHESQWVAIVGVSLSSKVGAQTLSVIQRERAVKSYFTSRIKPIRHNIFQSRINVR